MATSTLVLGSFTPTAPPDPEADSFADQLVRRFEPWLTADLETYLRAVASMFDQVVELTWDTDDDEGWTILFDPLRCPAASLPYLAQFVGERLPGGITEAGAREWIQDAPNRRRGVAESVFKAAQRRLTGGRLVSMQERYQGAVDVVAIRTNSVETPYPERVRADILSVLPADVILDYSVVTGATWDDAKVSTWTTTKAKTWSQLTSGLTGWSQYQRPQ